MQKYYCYELNLVSVGQGETLFFFQKWENS